MAEGIRVTQGASSAPRITQAGARRITEHAVMAGGLFAAVATMAPVAVVRRRAVATTLSAAPAMNAAIRGKVAVSAVLTAAGAVAPTALNARRGAGATLTTTPQFLPAIGRVRPVCVAIHAGAQLHAAPTRGRNVQVPLIMGAAVAVTVRKRAAIAAALSADTAMQAGQDVPLQRRRSAGVDLSVSASLAPIALRKRAFVSAHMTAAPTVTFGRDETGVYRILEDGSPRVTQSGNRRLIEESFAWGNIVVVHPPFKIFSHAGGLWYVLKPSAKAGNWQLPQGVSVHWQGGWRDVISNK